LFSFVRYLVRTICRYFMYEHWILRNNSFTCVPWTVHMLALLGLETYVHEDSALFLVWARDA